MAKVHTVDEAVGRVCEALRLATKGMTSINRVYVLDAVAEHVRLALQQASKDSIAARHGATE